MSAEVLNLPQGRYFILQRFGDAIAKLYHVSDSHGTNLSALLPAYSTPQFGGRQHTPMTARYLQADP